MTMEDIRVESLARRSGSQLMAVVTEGITSKEYRPPTPSETELVTQTKQPLEAALASLPNVSIDQLFLPSSTRSISAHLYGVRTWRDLFTSRQALAIATLGKAVHHTEALATELGYPEDWVNAIADLLCLGLDRLLSFSCVNVRWKSDADSLTDAFSRFSISLLWDFAEAQPLGTAAGSYIRCNERIAMAIDGLLPGVAGNCAPNIENSSATEDIDSKKFDLIITDPPYYEAVSYADLSDFFFTWLRGFRRNLRHQLISTLPNIY